MVNQRRFLAIIVASSALIFASVLVGKERLILNDIQWPPYLFSQKHSEFEGFATEVLGGCFEQLDYQVEYASLPVKRTEVFMRAGKLDITIYSKLEKRKEFVYYAKEPLFTSEYGFAVAYDREIIIRQLEDILPFNIGHLSGLTHTPELLKIIDYKRQNEQLWESNDVDLLLKQLIADPPRIDIIPNSKETFFWRIKQQGLEGKIRVLDFPVARKDYFVTVSKASKNIPQPKVFLDQIDTCLKEMKSNGKYRKIAQKYGLLNLL